MLVIVFWVKFIWHAIFMLHANFAPGCMNIACSIVNNWDDFMSHRAWGIECCARGGVFTPHVPHCAHLQAGDSSAVRIILGGSASTLEMHRADLCGMFNQMGKQAPRCR
jgi:hypothetical protein